MDLLSDAFLERIISQLDGEDVVAIGLTGSHARGAATPYSDVDLYCFGKQPASDAYDRYTLRLIDDRLVSITRATIEAKREDMRAPDTAIWAVPGLRQMQILLDKNGDLAALKQEAEAFEWEPLQPAADHYASAELMGYAEEAHKILGGLVNGNDSTMLYGTYGLVLGVARVLLVQGGVLIESENAFFQRAEEAAGSDSEWSRHFRIAAGFATLPECTVHLRAAASLRLYRATVERLHAIIEPAHIEVADMTIRRMDSFLTNR